MSVSPLQILIILALALLLFGGRGKISALMGDLAKGITSFRKGLKEGDDSVKAVSDTHQTIDAAAEPRRSEEAQER